MPRRIYTYSDDLGLNAPNLASTVGAFVIAASTLVFLYNLVVSHRRKEDYGVEDPWDARTLEWTIPSPTPVYNFAEAPVVHDVDDFWHKKYTEDENGRLVKIARTDEELADAARRREEALANAGSIHLPSPSFYPIIVAFGLPIIAYGMTYKAYLVSIFGGILMLGGFYGWALEPSAEPHHDHGDHDAVEGEHDREDDALVAAGATPALDAGTAGTPEPATPGGTTEPTPEA
jgi:cytochrome c oxidase subunit 1